MTAPGIMVGEPGPGTRGIIEELSRYTRALAGDDLAVSWAAPSIWKVCCQAKMFS
jgi:hypothetical protein